MKKRLILAMAAMVMLFGGAGAARAEVKRVEMRIDGYLCGN